MWLNICAGDTRGLYSSTLLGSWTDNGFISYIKCSQPGGLQFPAVYIELTAFKRGHSYGFTQQKQFGSQDSSLVPDVKIIHTFCLAAAFLNLWGLLPHVLTKMSFIQLPKSREVEPEGCDGSCLFPDVFSFTFRSDRHLWSSLVCVNINLH